MSSGHYEEFIAFLEMEMSQIDTKNYENPKSSQLSKIICNFSPNLLTDLWIGTLKRGNKEKLSCPVGFSEEFIAVFSVKMPQINTKNPKKP